MPIKKRQNLAETDKGSYYKEEWLEEFLDSNGACYNGNESDNNEFQMKIRPQFLNSLVNDIRMHDQKVAE